MTQTEHFLTDRKNWLFGHLHEAAARGADDDANSDALLEKVFGVTIQENNRFWQETMMMDNEYGFWPEIHFGLPQGHVVSVIYYGVPKYEVEYRYSTPSGESFLLAVESGHAVLPGFRWPEVKAISSLIPHIAPLVLLSLLPAVHISSDEESEAQVKIRKVLSELGFHSSANADFCAMLVNGARLNMEWSFDEKHGWITDYARCWRCPKRSEAGLTERPSDFFLALKNFTEYLNLNKNTNHISLN